MYGRRTAGTANAAETVGYIVATMANGEKVESKMPYGQREAKKIITQWAKLAARNTKGTRNAGKGTVAVDMEFVAAF